MIYPHSVRERFDAELFRDPPAEFRGAPFWAWNGRLEEAELLQQLEVFRAMGLGGAHMHVRVGLEIPYLGDEFMALIRACVEESERLGLRAWLYDEDRWPSGAAGGLVTQDPSHRMRHLLVTRTPYETSTLPQVDPNDMRFRHSRSDDGELVRAFAVRVEHGMLAEYRPVPVNESGTSTHTRGRPQIARPGEFLIYVYVERNRSIPWYNNQAYLDTLNPEAVREFVNVTHERYRQVVGSWFGGVVPAIFTDEPQYNKPGTLPAPEAGSDVILPFTTDFDETYRLCYGEAFLDRVPEFVWENDRAGTVRYRFFDHVTERFASAFADVVGEWCDRNGIALTGHMMEEPTLTSQTHAVGAAMRSYRGFQLPGIDLLADRIELTTAKQAQSAARQYGREGVLSELYGVTGWHFGFRGHKLQGDWQAALGVTVRVHHLAWVTMQGEAKRDYPASIGYQSPWWMRYPLVEDHFARLNTALTRGTAICRVGVIHPIESCWMSWGPESQTAADREEQDRRFQDLADWLLRSQIDFDYLDESLLADRGDAFGTRLKMGAASYDVVVVPYLRTIRSSTLDLLERLLSNGGAVIVAGELPAYADGIVSDRPGELLSSTAGAGRARTVRVPFTRTGLLAALEPYREIAVEADSGQTASNVIYQLRRDGPDRWLFLSHVDRPEEPSIPEIERLTVSIAGTWELTLYDTLRGTTSSIDASRVDSGERPWTRFSLAMTAHDSLLLRLAPASSIGPATAQDIVTATPELGIVLGADHRLTLPEPSSYSLSEPNVLLLDMAEWRLDTGEWHPTEEILRLDQAARELLGWPRRGGRMAQPWVEPDDVSEQHSVTMRFTVESEINVDGCELALERPAQSSVRIDGQALSPADAVPDDSGYWVDRSIRTIALPPLDAGRHEIEVTSTISRRAGLEWCYLLGRFGVRVRGRQATVEALPERLFWGDITTQGFPFYAGNVAYTVTPPEHGPVALQIADFSSPVLDVELGGALLGSVAWAPYVVALPGRPSSSDEITVTAYGNRQNAFGPVHNAHRDLRSYGPPAWRTSGTAWSYAYCLEPSGVLAAPALVW